MIHVCSGDLAADALRPLWDEMVEHHRGLRADAQGRGWEGEHAELQTALQGGAGGFVVVAEPAATPTGYARVAIGKADDTIWPPVERVAQLHTMSVSESRRGRGLGGELVQAAVGELVARRVPVLFVGFWPENLAARRFYERCGFQADGRGRWRRPCP